MWGYCSEGAAAGESWTNCVFLSLQVLGLKLPNMLGRAEKLTFQFSYGTKETSYGLSFFKPQPGHFERKYVSILEVFWILCSWCVWVFAHILTTMNDCICFSLTLNMYKVTGQFPWSSLKETDRGMSAEVNVRGCILPTCLVSLPNKKETKGTKRCSSCTTSWPHCVCFGCELKVSLCLCSCSSLSGWPTTHWSGRVYGGSWAAWHAAPLSPCARRVDTLWNLPSRYSLPSHHGFLLSLVSSENIMSFILQRCAEVSGIVCPPHTFSRTLVLFVCSTLCQ